MSLCLLYIIININKQGRMQHKDRYSRRVEVSRARTVRCCTLYSVMCNLQGSFSVDCNALKIIRT